MDINITEHEPVKRQFNISFTMDEDQAAEFYALMAKCNVYQPTGEWTYKLFNELGDTLGYMTFTEVNVTYSESTNLIEFKR